MIPPANAQQHPSSQRGLLMLRKPGRTLWDEEQPHKFQRPDNPCHSQDHPPQIPFTQEIPQRLRQQNAHVRHDLREGPKEPPRARRCNLGYVDGADHGSSARAHACDQPPEAEHADAGREAHGQGTEDEEESGGAQGEQAAIAGCDGAGQQGTQQAAQGVDGRDQAKVARFHGDALGEMRVGSRGRMQDFSGAGDDILGSVEFGLCS